MDITKLFSISYLFEKNPGNMYYMIYVVAIFFLLLILTAIILQIFLKVKSLDPLVLRYLRRAPGMLYVFGIVGLVLVWFRYEHAIFLSMRIWLLILLILFVYWLVRFILSHSEIQKERTRLAELEKMKRYQH